MKFVGNLNVRKRLAKKALMLVRRSKLNYGLNHNRGFLLDSPKGLFL